MAVITRFQEELELLCHQNNYRSLRTLTPKQGSSTKAYYEEQEYLLFCSNDYLGLSHNERLIAKAQEVAQSCGVGSGASRLISGTTTWHSRLEERFARFKKKEAALVFPTGFMTNLGVITALTGKDDVLIIDKLNHASIVDACNHTKGILRVYPHKNMKKLETILKQYGRAAMRLIITDSVFSMDGDIAPLQEIINLKKKYDAMIMIDEAHGTGVFGKRGSGVAEELQVERDVDITIGTLSKAIGGLGGYVAGNRTLIEYLKNRSKPFIYTTSLPALMCAVACEALEIIEQEPSLRQRLWDNVRLLKSGLDDLCFSYGASVSPIIPLIVGESEKALAISQYLLDNNIFVPAVRPPTVPNSSSRLRITVSAAHAKEEIEYLVSTLKKSKERFSL